MQTLYKPPTFRNLLIKVCPVAALALLLSVGVLTASYINQKKRLDMLAKSNEVFQRTLLQINPAILLDESTVGLQEKDLKMDRGTLMELFKVESGVFYGIVYKDRVSGSIPVWFFGTGEPPKRGSNVFFLHHYIQFKGGTEVLAFSRLEPNL